jgi:uncharacterized protein YpmB
MKRKKALFLIIIILIVALFFSSCSFIENNMAYIDSTEDAVNTIYTASIVGLVLFLWGREF